MSYVTTNIRLQEEDYLNLKEEAARSRKSLSAVIREKLKPQSKLRSKDEVEELVAHINKMSSELGSKLKGFDSVKELRKIRYENK